MADFSMSAPAVLLFLGLISFDLPAEAQEAENAPTASQDGRVTTSQQVPEAQSAEPAAPGAPHAEIVVTGKRYGEAEVPSEIELDESQVADYSVDTIRALLREMQPLIDGSDGQPVVLVNGKRIADPRDIASFPPEALQRVEILPREAASRYGYDPEKRVVNLVLKQQFKSYSGQFGLTIPTAGGRNSEQLTFQRAVIAGDARWGIEATLRRETSLSESSRAIPAAPGLGSVAGNVYAIASELDPALSQAAGTTVASASVPMGASGALELSDFLATANRPSAPGDAAWRSLVPASRALSLTASLSRPLGGANLSVTLRAGHSRSERLLGLASASLLLPASNPFSPFSNDVQIERLLGEAPLQSIQNSSNAGVSTGLSGKLLGTQANLSLVFDHAEGDSRSERGVDMSGSASRIAAGDSSLDPFGRLPVGAILADRSTSRTDSASLQLALVRPVFRLPSGPVQLNLNAGLSRSSANSRFEDSGGIRSDRSTNGSQDARLSIALPITRRKPDGTGGIGELNTNLAMGIVSTRGGTARLRGQAGLSWSPVRAANFNFRMSVETEGPSAEQQDAPRLETPETRIYDYATGEVALVTRITGGNPTLRRGQRQSLGAGGSLRLSETPLLSLNFDYQRQTSSDGIGSLPELTPSIEAAFPERVTRDGQGHLVSIDMRPINLLRERTSSLRTGIRFLLQVGGVRPGNGAGEVRSGAANMAGPGSPAAGNRRPAGATRLQLNLNHSLQLSNGLLIREGLPMLDRMQGDGGGQSRHRVQLQAGLSTRGVGGFLSMNWSSGYRTRVTSGVDGNQDLLYAARLTAQLRLSLGLGALAGAGQKSIFKGMQASLEVSNLFDSRLHVTRADGSVPAGYGRDETDPIGRTVQLTLQRRF